MVNNGLIPNKNWFLQIFRHIILGNITLLGFHKLL